MYIYFPLVEPVLDLMPLFCEITEPLLANGMPLVSATAPSTPVHPSAFLRLPHQQSCLASSRYTQMSHMSPPPSLWQLHLSPKPPTSAQIPATTYSTLLFKLSAPARPPHFPKPRVAPSHSLRMSRRAWRHLTRPRRLPCRIRVFATTPGATSEPPY